MALLAVVVCAGVAGCASRTSPFHAGESVDREAMFDATEVALRHVFRNEGWGAVDYYCLGAGSMTAVGPSNPPSELMGRFTGRRSRPPVVRATSCEVTPEGVRHRATRTPAQLFLVQRSEWRARNQMVVIVRSYVNRYNTNIQQCRLTRTEGVWTLEHCLERLGP